MHCAAKYGLERVARALARPVDEPGQLGTTPLMLAAQSGSVACVRALLELGAQANLCNQFGRTALALAAARGHAEVVGALCDAGADPNMVDADGIAPLHWAAAEGHVDAARALLAGGAYARARSKTGKSVSDVAREAGCTELVVELRARAPPAPPGARLDAAMTTPPGEAATAHSPLSLPL